MAGLIARGSSNDPTGSIVSPGITSADCVIVDPHSGQKSRCVGLPLSPTSLKRFVVPVTVKLAVGTATTVPKALPVLFWQLVQWQIPVKAISADEAKVTLPQRQLPLISGILEPPLDSVSTPCHACAAISRTERGVI
jgi:hypothetical protein